MFGRYVSKAIDITEQEKLAFHYIWENIFWKRKTHKIEWLDKEIRL